LLTARFPLMHSRSLSPRFGDPPDLAEDSLLVIVPPSPLLFQVFSGRPSPGFPSPPPLAPRHETYTFSDDFHSLVSFVPKAPPFSHQGFQNKVFPPKAEALTPIPNSIINPFRTFFFLLGDLFAFRGSNVIFFFVLEPESPHPFSGWFPLWVASKRPEITPDTASRHIRPVSG